MSYFLGVFPDQNANFRIRKVNAELARVFDSQGIPIMLVQPEQFHITVIWLGQDLSWIQKKLVNFKLRRWSSQPFEITLDRARLGFSKSYRELLYLDVDRGSDRLRDMVPKLMKLLRIKRDKSFIPHITLGRVGKDLSDEEYKNLTNEIYRISKLLLDDPIRFEFRELSFVHSHQGEFNFLKKLPT